MSDIATPKTRYAQSGDCEIAYQALGDAPLDVVFIPNSISHLELGWEHPAYVRIYRALGSFARLLLFDRRGCGLSGAPATPVLALEDWIDDTIAVMNAAGSRRAALIGSEAGGPMAVLLAATFPERVKAVVLVNTYARAAWAPDYPCGVPQEVIDELALPSIAMHWGDGFTYGYSNPQIRDDPSLVAWYARAERYAMTPKNATQAWRTAFAVDVRDILPNVQAPTLIVHASHNPAWGIEHARYLARRIPNAQLVEYDDNSHAGFLYEHADLFIDQTQAFLTGEGHTPEPDRVLATVLFTDIVGSTEQAARLGDRRWRRLLESHHNLTRDQIDSYRGRLVKSTGDGILATFDGPARAIHSAHAIHNNARSLGLEIRVGVHTGEIELIGDDIGGLAVHIAQRIQALAEPGEVLASSTVKDLVIGSGIAFTDRGTHALKGIPNQWRLFAATH